ncbi:MAG: type II secretion system protein [Proteobacteria bacterium]|nr:type II secretion system protein [Pseudomonadota bacterium]
MDKAQKGFTLIELVVVITILGILAAFAFPRFAALEVEARIATVNGLTGSLRSAASLAHSLALVTGTVAVGPILMEGQSIVLVQFYPADTHIDDTLQDFTGFTFLAGLFSKNGAPTPATCSVDYAEPTGANLPPTITPLTGGC